MFHQPMFPIFDRYMGIDYSGAQTPTSSLKGLRVYMAGRELPPIEVQPPPSPRKYWTRRGIAEWLEQELSGAEVSLVGIDHAFSFPLRYFEVHRLEPNWKIFLDDFHRHWPTDGDHATLSDFQSGVNNDPFVVENVVSAEFVEITPSKADDRLKFLLG